MRISKALSGEATALIAGNPEDSSAVLTAVGGYVDAGRADLAKLALTNFLDVSPENVEATIALSRLELASGNLAKAEELFLRAKSLDDRNLESSLGLASIAEANGDTEEGIHLLEAALVDHPTEVAPRIWLAQWYLEAGRMQDAERAVNQVIEIGFRSPEISEMVGSVLLQIGRPEEAMTYLKAAESYNRESAEFQFMLAQAHLGMGHTIEAKSVLRDALDLSPDMLPAKATLILIELRQGRASEALSLVDELRSKHTANPVVMVLEGEVYLYLEQYEAAANAYRRAVKAGAGRQIAIKEYEARQRAQMQNLSSH